jgi:hypothetical protein
MELKEQYLTLTPDERNRLLDTIMGHLDYDANQVIREEMEDILAARELALLPPFTLEDFKKVMEKHGVY